MSSISSASSRARKVTWSSFRVRRFMWSRARPGVATTTSAPRFKARICRSMGAPPYTGTTLRFSPFAYLDGLGHLHGQLPGGDEDEAAGDAALGAVLVDPLEHRQGEGGRLARAGG